MGTVNREITRYEITGVYTHPDALADIVLVHGLNGQPDKTWTAGDVFWPTDLLPNSLQDHHANILVYGYNADVYAHDKKNGPSKDFILQHAESLVNNLTIYRKRENMTRKPIIWVAHSLGGILVKRALLYAYDAQLANHDPLRAIYVSTYGIIFLGTPHNGSGLATWGHILQAMSDAVIPKKLFHSESVLIETLKRNNETLSDINNRFLNIFQNYRIQMVRESQETDFKGTKALVVDESSANPQLPGVEYYGIEATHSNMCKFGSPSAPGYLSVSRALYEWVGEAPGAMEARWELEDRRRMDLAELDIYERRRPLTTRPNVGAAARPDEMANSKSLPPITGVALLPAAASGPAEPPFVHPDPFRPNSFFVGREKELGELHAKLMDEKRRAGGTSAVLIQCLPGGGKTHLAREYVFRHLADYPGGIFWVRAKSITEVEEFYWKMANSEGLHDLADKVKRTVPAEEQGNSNSHKKRYYIEVVRTWFKSFDQWLLIFDGIRFDTPGMSMFIPDAKYTSLIYTSIQHPAVGMYEFDDPQILELGLLSPVAAQGLLLEEMGARKPWSPDDRARALELVRLMGYLPLMIHVAARHINAIREPLYKYLRNYQGRHLTLHLPAYNAVYSELEKRGEHAALNLMSILAFYDQWIPVGMILLGISALKKATPVMTQDAWQKTKSFNNTLRVLIAFALVERTETDSASPASSQGSAKPSFDRSHETVDVLRMHSVVQAFFVDRLAEKKELEFWLEQAVAVFCASFDEVDQKMGEGSRYGIADDYCRFVVHGRKLLDHVPRAEKRCNAPAKWKDMRQDVEARLVRCQAAIDTLAKAHAAAALEEGSKGKAVESTSAFEWANGLSESESGSLSSQFSLYGSRGPSRIGTGVGEHSAGSSSSSGPWIPDGEGGQLHGSPTHYHTPQTPSDQNPLHWHVAYPAYPSGDGMIFAPPDGDEGDDRTEIETPRMPNSRGGSLPGAMATDARTKRATPDHRTLRKQSIRRYHDRAGSWRDSTVSDPRTSISREMARGNVTGPETSAAKTALDKIRAVAVSSEAAVPPILGVVNDASDASAPIPIEIEHRAAAGDSVSHSFASGLWRMLPKSLPSRWTSPTMKRLREDDDSAVSEEEQHKSNSLSSSIASLINKQPAPMFRGSRSARSSPGQGQGPFRPPPAVLPADGGWPQQGPPAAMRQWETQAYSSGRMQFDPSDLSFDMAGGDPIRASFPPPPRASRPSGDSYADKWLSPPLEGADGYTSQPMSRGGSSQSQPAENGHGVEIPPRRSSRYTSVDGHSSYPYGLPPGYGAGRAAYTTGMPFLEGRAAASWVETEPSPSTGDAFPEVNTSYQRWGERQRHVAVEASMDPAGEESLQEGDVYTSEPMERNGSAGIQLSDGRIVPFGQSPRAVQDMAHEVDSVDGGAAGGIGLGITTH